VFSPWVGLVVAALAVLSLTGWHDHKAEDGA